RTAALADEPGRVLQHLDAPGGAVLAVVRHGWPTEGAVLTEQTPVVGREPCGDHVAQAGLLDKAVLVALIPPEVQPSHKHAFAEQIHERTRTIGGHRLAGSGSSAEVSARRAASGAALDPGLALGPAPSWRARFRGG